MITDPEGKIIYVNQKFTEMTGYSGSEALGQNPRMLKGGDGRTDYKEMWRILLSAQKWHGDFHNKKKNEVFFWERATISPILDQRGTITHFLAIKEDISERKKLKIDFLLEDCDDLISESLDGSERVRKIVQNLKTFSRVDQEGEQLADLNECLESTIAIVWNEIKYNAQLEKEFSELPDLQCNQQELSQVFTNILANAAQSISKEGLIRVRSWLAENTICISFQDNGCGMTSATKMKIFEPFLQPSRLVRGPGLG